jgi:hypothetical protein
VAVLPAKSKANGLGIWAKAPTLPLADGSLLREKRGNGCGLGRFFAVKLLLGGRWRRRGISRAPTRW